MKNKLVYIILFLILSTTLLYGGKFTSSGSVAMNYINKDEINYSTDTALYNFLLDIQYSFDDKNLIKVSTEVVTAKSVMTYRNDDVKYGNNISAVIIEELLYKYNFNNTYSLSIGKFDFRTDNKEIFITPSERKPYTSPIMINTVLDAVFLTYNNNDITLSAGIVSDDMLFNPFVYTENFDSDLPYSDTHGVIITGMWEATKKLTLNLNIYYGEAHLMDDHDIVGGMYGMTTIYDDSINSGITAYLYGAYSNLTTRRHLVGYSFLVGLNYNYDLPFINKESTIGLEVMSIQNDYYSFNNGRFLSIYKSDKNGYMPNIYFEYVIRNYLSFKAMYSYLFADGYSYTPTSGTIRTNAKDVLDRKDVRAALIYKF